MKKALVAPLLLTALSIAMLAVSIGDTLFYYHAHRLLNMVTTIAGIMLPPFAVVAWREYFKKR